MAERVFTKDTMLDLVVNIIPLGILAFFVGLFVLWGPYSWDPLYSTLMLGIIVVAGVLLTILTYFSAIAIEGDANEREAAERAAADAAAEDAVVDGNDASGGTADDAAEPADGEPEEAI